MLNDFIWQVCGKKRVHHTLSKAQQVLHSNIASNETDTGCGDVSRPLRSEEAESVASQLRDILASPPAATGSFNKHTTKPGLLALKAVALLSIGLLGLSACSTAPEELKRSQQAQSQASDSEQQRALSPTAAATGQPDSPAKKTAQQTPAPKDAAEQLAPSQVPTQEPKFEPSKPYQHKAVAFEAKDDKLPKIRREGQQTPADQKVKVSDKPAAGSGKYADDIKIVLKLKDQGKVKSEGPGYFTGAPYAVFELTVQNNSAKELDLSGVLITAVTDQEDIAQPLYGEVETYDFSGVVAAGENQKTDYAFMVSTQTKSLTLHIDLDSAHQPMVFKQKLAKK